MDDIFDVIDWVRIINLVDRTDRRREMEKQLHRVGGASSNTAFFLAQRPSDAGEFPSIGARGCFESHLNILRAAYKENVSTLLIIEDDFTFLKGGPARAAIILQDFVQSDHAFFYGSHILTGCDELGVVEVPSETPIMTASFVLFHRKVMKDLIFFLDGLLSRPAGSPNYGPMHIDGAYSIFRRLHPQYKCVAAFPPIGEQRSSRSDITPTNMLLDRWMVTRHLGDLLRRARNALRA